MGKGHDSRRSLYRFLCVLLLIAGGLGIALYRGGKEERKQVNVLAFAEEEIPTQVEEEIQKIPGLRSLQPVCKGEISLQVEKYQMDTQIYGVNLEEYPFAVEKSYGAVSYGNQLLLVAGKEGLTDLQDENGRKITKKQLENLLAEGEKISITAEEEGCRLLALVGNKKQPDAHLYGDYPQIQTYFKSRKKQSYSGFWLCIQGQARAQSAIAALEKAGFSVEEIK